MTTKEQVWFKSSYSGSSGDNCIEVALCAGDVLVRDSKDKCGHALTVSPEAWTAFARLAADSRI
ncbi:DUF397 domain-containing protein [Streptomyces atroolivaceus]|uniref:DUF397 domain-containing protein n=1 Tax=Streptomyces atroolivaceus TaxID=66869 RepID=UPI00368C1CE3